jgi:hypothetical protein
MSATSSSTADFVYKRKYGGLVHEEERRHPTLSSTKKVGGIGLTNHYVVAYGDGQGAAAGTNFSTAQTNISPIKGVQFNMAPKIRYRLAQVDGVSSVLSMGDPNAFESLVMAEMRGNANGMMNDLGFDLFRDGTGNRGVRASLSSNTVTLTVKADSRNFFIGMTVKAGTSTTSLRAGSTTVTAVDYDAGTVTLASAAAITSFADADILFREGETGNILMEGFASIIPLTAPVFSSDSFRGIDRGVQTTLLAGARLAADGSTPEELAMRVAAAIFDAGGDSDELILSPLNAQAMCNRGSAKITYPDGGGTMTIGFTGAVLQSPAGQLKLVSDPDCPSNRGYVRKKSTWQIEYGGPSLVHSTYDDAKFTGKFWFPVYNADTIEGRSRVICNLKCTEPRSNGVFEIA